MPPTTPQQPKPPSNPVPASAQPSVSAPTVAPPPGFGAGVAAANQQQVEQNLKTTEEKYKRTKLFLYISIGVAAIGLLAAIGFGILWGNAERVNATKYDSGVAAGKAEQEKIDKNNALIASQGDTRTYTAPNTLGAFTLDIPKTYSISTTTSGSTPLLLLANPDQVDVNAKNLALRVTVKNQVYSKTREGYDREAKEARSGLKAGEEIKVSDRNAVRYVGKFDRRSTPGTLVLVEYLDKTILIQTDNNEDATLLSAYDKILSSVRIP